MNLKECLNKEKARLSWFMLKERILQTLDASSLSRLITAPALSVLGSCKKVAHLGKLFLTNRYAADLNEDLSDVRQHV